MDNNKKVEISQRERDYIIKKEQDYITKNIGRFEVGEVTRIYRRVRKYDSPDLGLLVRDLVDVNKEKFGIKYE